MAAPESRSVLASQGSELSLSQEGGPLGELRAFVLHDLQIMGRQDEGVNYAAVLVILSACDALGTLRYGREHSGAQFFQDYVLPSSWREVGQDLWNALRNGLSHSYQTKTVLRLGTPVDISVSWREKPNLTYDITTNQLFVNVQDMISALHHAFDRYEGELQADPAMLLSMQRRLRRRLEVHVPTGRQEIWRRVLQPFGFAG